MNLETQILELASLAYDAAADPQAWPTFLERLAHAIDADGTVLFAAEVEAPLNSIAALTRFDPELINRYVQEFADNIWVRRADARFKSNEVRYSQGLASTQELLRDRYYEDFLRPADVAHSVSLKIPYGASFPAYLATTRSLRKPAFDEQDGRLLLALEPHVRRALHLHRRMGANMAFSGLLDALPFGIAFADQSSRLLWWNRYAEDLFQAKDGLSVARDGFQTARPNEAHKLARLIRQASALGTTALPGGGGMSITRPSLRKSYTVLVSPLKPGAGPVCQAVVAVLITDPERSAPLGTEERLAAQFGFTRAEARVAAALMKGGTVESISQEYFIQVSTVRTHLRRLLQKTGTARQTDLMRVLLSGPFLLGT